MAKQDQWVSDAQGARKRKTDSDPRPLWKKHIGGGTMRLTTGYKVKFNEEFRAWEDQIPLAGREQVKKLEDGFDPEQEEPQNRLDEQADERQEQPVVKNEFYLQHRGGPWYDVITPDGSKKMNTKALKAEDAQNYCDELNGKND
jgi:hypothetical protein